MRFLAAVLVCVTVASSAVASTTGSLIVNTTSPAVFTAVYPQAARQKIGQQQPFNPIVQVNCSNGYQDLTIMRSESNNKNGTWTGTTYPLTVPGPADCVATLSYYDKDPATHALIYVFVASAWFSVAA